MKNIKFGNVFGTIKIYLNEHSKTLNEGRKISVLRGALMIFLIAINTLSFSQSVNYRRVENAHIINRINGDTLSSHSSDIEAIQELQNRKAEGIPVKMFGAVYEVDLTEKAPNEIIIDTFTTIADYILLDYTDSLVQPTEESQKYALIMNVGLAEIEADTIHRWQSIFKLERTRRFGESRYKSIDLPFQFRDSLMLQPDRTSYRLQTFATKKHCVSYYLNNQEYSMNRSCDPGKLSDIEWRHTMTYTDLEPNTEYLIRIEGTSEVGEFDFKEFKIKTLQ